MKHSNNNIESETFNSKRFKKAKMLVLNLASQNAPIRSRKTTKKLGARVLLLIFPTGTSNIIINQNRWVYFYIAKDFITSSVWFWSYVSAFLKWGLISPAISRNPTCSLSPNIFFSFSSHLITLLFVGSCIHKHIYSVINFPPSKNIKLEQQEQINLKICN